MRLGGFARGAIGVAALGAVGVWIAHRDRSPMAGRPPTAEIATPRPPPPPPPPPWTTDELRDLLRAVGKADREGLRPTDYAVDSLQDAVAEDRTGPAVDAIADRAASSLAHDYAAGRIRNRHRFNWYIDYAGPGPDELARQVVAARSQGRLGEWLHGLLPAGADYRALRDALADLPADDADRRDRILANMERWRWLPRDGGQGDRLYVNLPTYRLEVIERERVAATYRAVIGATDMPTPVLSADVRQIIANPDWIVPPSIVRRSHLRPGASSRYIFSTRPDGTLRVRQKPGPGNALGRVKIEFPNALAIYFHDTPSKSLFGASERAFSHGCVRVQNIERLAASLVARPDRLTQALKTTTTVSLRPTHRWQASIVYLTMVADKDGGGVRFVGDPYRMDPVLAAALEKRKPRAINASPEGPERVDDASKPSASMPLANRTSEVEPVGDDPASASPLNDAGNI